MTSERMRKTNRENAQHSTGPHNTDVTSQNAIQHGILSKKLFLEDEDANDFDALLEELRADRDPVGPIEEFIVQRIAVTIWRQWRLVRAETAQIELERQIGSEAMRSKAAQVIRRDKTFITQEDFQPLQKNEEGDLKSYQLFLEEYQKNRSRLSQYSESNLPALEQDMPAIYEMLEFIASQEGQNAATLLQVKGASSSGQNVNVLEEWIKNIAGIFQKEVNKLLPRQLLSGMIDALRQSLSTPQRSDLVARYQTALDNELYKGLRELERVQKWRRKSIDLDVENLVGEQPNHQGSEKLAEPPNHQQPSVVNTDLLPSDSNLQENGERSNE